MRVGSDAGVGRTDEVGFRAQARMHPSKVALVHEELRLSYRELEERSWRAARVLRDAGVKPRDRVAVALRNRPEFLELALGCAFLDCELVPTSWRYKDAEVRWLMQDSAARLLIAEDDGADGGSAALRLGRYQAASCGARCEPMHDDDPAVRIRFYTSGTTGSPKAVERERTDRATLIRSIVLALGVFDLARPCETYLCVAPLYHTAPLSFCTQALQLGQTVVLESRFNASEALRAIERERVTWTFMVPTHFVRLLRLPEFERSGRDLSSLRRVLHAAAPCPPKIKRAVLDVFPAGTVWEFYGMTEGRATLISPEEWLRKPGSVGRAMPGVTVKVLDEQGNELAPGEVGLVYVSPLGDVGWRYAGAPDKTAAAWRDGVFTVGDLGFLDEDGYLYLSDRREDLIITGGANVYPAEVEAVLHGHSAVTDAVVVGVPDDEWGQRVCAVVEARQPVDAAELIALCRRQLAHYKCPNEVEVVEALPRDPNGKIRRHEVRARYGRPREGF